MSTIGMEWECSWFSSSLIPATTEHNGGSLKGSIHQAMTVQSLL